jgi:soluble lytic murein transglycosylase-like protein
MENRRKPMRTSMLASFVLLGAFVSGCADLRETPTSGTAAAQSEAVEEPGGSLDTAEGAKAKVRARELRPAIERHARENALPVSLAEAVIRIESNYNPKIVHAGNYGLMQIRLATARSLGFTGTPAELLDPDTNLRFGLKYLGGAYQQAQGNLCRTIMKYQSGFLAVRMNSINRTYCQRVKMLMTS